MGYIELGQGRCHRQSPLSPDSPFFCLRLGGSIFFSIALILVSPTLVFLVFLSYSSSSIFFFKLYPRIKWVSQVALVVKNVPANAGDIRDAGLSPRSPGGGHGNPLSYSGLENPAV